MCDLNSIKIELFLAKNVLNTDILNCRTRSNHLACECPNAWTIKNYTSNKKNIKNICWDFQLYGLHPTLVTKMKTRCASTSS